MQPVGFEHVDIRRVVALTQRTLPTVVELDPARVKQKSASNRSAASSCGPRRDVAEERIASVDCGQWRSATHKKRRCCQTKMSSSHRIQRLFSPLRAPASRFMSTDSRRTARSLYPEFLHDLSLQPLRHIHPADLLAVLRLSKGSLGLRRQSQLALPRQHLLQSAAAHELSTSTVVVAHLSLSSHDTSTSVGSCFSSSPRGCCLSSLRQ